LPRSHRCRMYRSPIGAASHLYARSPASVAATLMHCFTTPARCSEDFDRRHSSLTPVLQFSTRPTTRTVVLELIDSLQKDAGRTVAVLIDEAGGGDPCDAVHAGVLRSGGGEDVEPGPDQNRASHDHEYPVVAVVHRWPQYTDAAHTDYPQPPQY